MDEKKKGRPSVEVTDEDLRYGILAVDLNKMSVKEVCEDLGISRSTFYRLRGEQGYEELPL